MRIFCAGVFYPQVGGMERMLEMVARELYVRGHDVHVGTLSPPPQTDRVRTFPHAVTWQPSIRRAVALHRWADVTLHFGLGLRLAWPALLVRAPQVVSHQFYYGTTENEKRGREFLKNALTRCVTNVCASRAIAASIPGASTVIPNCYDETVFVTRGDDSRPRDFAFVGRLVSLKGVDLLLEALARLEKADRCPTLTIVGDGPERARLEAQAQSLGGRVTFLGSKPPVEIAAILRQHRVLVVPSRWNEPFGIVALEGIACGCVVVGSAGGGLADAIGPCGLTFPNGDAASLAEAMRRALWDAEWGDRARSAAPDHLREYTAAAVAARYEEVLLAVASPRGRVPMPTRDAARSRAPLFP